MPTLNDSKEKLFIDENERNTCSTGSQCSTTFCFDDADVVPFFSAFFHLWVKIFGKKSVSYLRKIFI